MPPRSTVLVFAAMASAAAACAVIFPLGHLKYFLLALALFSIGVLCNTALRAIEGKDRPEAN